MSKITQLVRRVLRTPYRRLKKAAERRSASSAMGAIRARRSVRDYSPKPVSEYHLREILEAARLAPYGGRPTIWKLGVIRDQKIKDELAECVAQSDLIRQTPVIIACCTECVPLEKMAEAVHGKVRRRYGEEVYQWLRSVPPRLRDSIYQDQNLIIAGEHLVIAARSLGLGTCWIGAISIDKVGRVLRLPENWLCLYLIMMGYPLAWPVEKPKRPLDEMVFYDRFS